MEEWRTVVIDGEVWDNYEVSNLGRVRSLNYNKTSKVQVLRQGVISGGYLQINLSKNGKDKMFLVHRLVAFAFVENDNPTEKTVVNHIDENPTNNIWTNLEWCTQKENINHGTRTKKVAQKIGKRVLCVETGVIYESTKDVERKTGLHQGNICRCCNKAYGYKTCGGYHWEYVD